MSAKKQKIESNEMEVNENIVENIAEDVNVAVIVEESLIDIKAIDSIRDRMEIYDKMREDVIKQARDVQKLSKLAIYSIHRGALKDSKNKLEQAMVFAMKIFQIVDNKWIQEITMAVSYYLHGNRIKLTAELPIGINVPVATETNLGAYPLMQQPDQTTVIPAGNVSRQTVVEARLQLQVMFR